jgi:hypothetical protein
MCARFYDGQLIAARGRWEDDAGVSDPARVHQP